MGVKTQQIDFFLKNKNNFLGILMLSLQSEVLFFKKILLLCKQHPFTFFIPILPLLYNFLGGWDAKIVCVIERATNFTNNFKISKITFSFYENKNQFTKFLPPFHSYYIIFLNFSKCNNCRSLADLIKVVRFSILKIYKNVQKMKLAISDKFIKLKQISMRNFRFPNHTVTGKFCTKGILLSESLEQ